MKNVTVPPKLGQPFPTYSKKFFFPPFLFFHLVTLNEDKHASVVPLTLIAVPIKCGFFFLHPNVSNRRRQLLQLPNL